jgi:hypothetical protein
MQMVGVKLRLHQSRLDHADFLLEIAAASCHTPRARTGKWMAFDIQHPIRTLQHHFHVTPCLSRPVSFLHLGMRQFGHLQISHFLVRNLSHLLVVATYSPSPQLLGRPLVTLVSE